MTVAEMIAEGDRVMVRWTSHGTHRGELFGVPPTNKQVIYSGINIFRIADGKIAEIWDIVDSLWLWQQLGVLPETAEFIAQAREAILVKTVKE
jgi:predicted ester cyclase